MVQAGCQRGAAPGGALACGPGPWRAAVRMLRICATGSPRARRKRACPTGSCCSNSRCQRCISASSKPARCNRATQSALLLAQPGHLLAQFQQAVLQQGVGHRRRHRTLTRLRQQGRDGGERQARLAQLPDLLQLLHLGRPVEAVAGRAACARHQQPQGFVVQHRAAGQPTVTGQAAQGQWHRVGSGAGHGGKGSRSGGMKCWRAPSLSSRAGE